MTYLADAGTVSSMATRRATDLQHLPPPDRTTIPGRDEVARQTVAVPVRWWRERLHPDQWPAFLTGSEAVRPVSRQEVHAEAAEVAAPGGGLRLLWASVAWGAGPRLRLCSKRIDAAHGASAVRAGPAGAARLDDQLREVARLANDRGTRGRAYETLHPGRGQLIRYLGPAFGSKFLYFAGCDAPEHPCLILDSRVAQSLRRRGWTSLGTQGGWPATTYERYCVLAQRWSDELQLESADQVEKWLFDQSR